VRTTAVPEAFAARSLRAAALAPSSAAAEQPLRFAAGLYRIQGEVAAALTGPALTGSLEADLRVLERGLGQIASYVSEAGPPALAAAARLRSTDLDLAWWAGSRSGATDYLARARLRPYVETLAALGTRPEAPAGPGGCDFCGGGTWIAARRAVTSGEGAQRILGCALCGAAKVIGRIACPACDEGKPDALPVFQGDRYPNARIEACTTCKRYVKSIDLTVDARAIPEVDDLLSLALDLWAVEEGYSRIEPGLAGI